MVSMYVYVTCAPIHACRRNGQYLVAFERGVVIYNVILAPLHDPTPSPLICGLQSLNMAAEDEEEPTQKVPRKS